MPCADAAAACYAMLTLSCYALPAFATIFSDIAADIDATLITLDIATFILFRH